MQESDHFEADSVKWISNKMTSEK